MRRRKNQTRAGRQEPCRENSKVVNVASSARSDREIALIRPATATRRRDLTTIATWRWNRRRRAPRRSDSSTRHEQSRDRRFKEKHPDSQDAETIGAFQRRDPASFSSFFTIVRRSFSGTAARGGPATIERDASSLREGDAASGATRRRKSPFLKQTHFTRRGRDRARFTPDVAAGTWPDKKSRTMSAASV